MFLVYPWGSALRLNSEEFCEGFQTYLPISQCSSIRKLAVSQAQCIHLWDPFNHLTNSDFLLQEALAKCRGEVAKLRDKWNAI